MSKHFAKMIPPTYVIRRDRREVGRIAAKLKFNELKGRSDNSPHAQRLVRRFERIRANYPDYAYSSEEGQNG